MTRSPAASVPLAMSSGGLPIGLQLVGPQHGDLVVLRTAAALEAAIDLDPLAVPARLNPRPSTNPTTQTADTKEPLPCRSPPPPTRPTPSALSATDDAPWADTGTGVLLKVVRFDSQHGTWVILNRFKPGVQLQTHRHTGSVDAFTSAGPLALPRVRLLRHGGLLPLRAGQLGAHAARARGQHGGHGRVLHH